MTPEPRDETLARRFAELRRADAQNAPIFASMWRASARASARVWWIAAPAFSVVAAAAAVALWIGLSPKSEEAPAHSAAAVAAASFAPPAPGEIAAMEPAEPLPLDFLLEQPSLATVPDFDSLGSGARGAGRP